MKKLALLFSLAALTIMGFSCAKKDNNNPTYQITANGCADQNGSLVSSTYCGYQYVNGQCVQMSTYQPAPTQYCNSNGAYGMYSCVQANTGATVPNQYCLNTGTTGFYTCIQTSTRTPVQAYLCQQNATTGAVLQQQCYGAYIYPANGQTYQCGIYTNCSGATMMTQSGQQVQCL